MSRRWTTFGAVIAASALTVGLASCGEKTTTTTTVPSTSSSSSSSSSSSIPTNVIHAKAVTIENFAFSPSTLELKVGDTILVTNKDSAKHTLTAKDGSFDTGTLEQGKSKPITFTKAGTFDIICSFHPNMTGKITIS